MPIATYQDLPCLSVQFRRSRGYAADSTLVTMLATDVGVDVDKLDVSTLKRPTGTGDKEEQEAEGEKAELVLDVAFPIEGGELPGKLKPEGVLVMAQANPADGKALKVSTNLFVAKVETVRDLGGGRALPKEGEEPEADEEKQEPARELLVRLTLVDERFFWTRGVVGRWSFNRPLGTEQRVRAKDSVGSDGKPLTRKGILEKHVLARLFRGYKPAEDSLAQAWNESPDTEFPTWSPAVVALSKLAQDTGAGAPCLRLDNEVALHAPGDGFRGDDSKISIGYAPDGKGKNKEQIPLAALEDAGGRGRASAFEPSYPDDYAIVSATSPTVATCAIDDWEPVLMINGLPFVLTEQLVKKLTGERFGLEWLRRFVMLPASEQGNVYLPDRILELFRKQAYRYWRLPGAEKISEGDEPSGVLRAVEGSGLIPNLSDAPVSPADSDVVDTPNESLNGFYNGEPGKNAHLLPLLARAERIAGKRLPVTVETYSWQVIKKKFEGNELQRKATEARNARRLVEEQVAIVAGQKQVANPLTKPPRPSDKEEIAAETGGLGLGAAVGALINVALPGIGGAIGSLTSTATTGATEEPVRQYVNERGAVKVLKTSEIMSKEGLSLDRGLLAKSMSMARAQARIASDVDPALGSNWDTAYKEQLTAEDARNGTGSVVYYELAKQLVALETRARTEKKGFLDSLLSLEAPESLKKAFEPYRAEAGKLMREAVKKLANLQEEQQVRAATGQERIDRVVLATALRNMPRTEDPGAAVVSAEFGVVRTSTLAGHVENVRVARAQLTSLRPAPVRVLFGATLRPRVDKLPDNRQPTGVTRGADGVLRVAAPRGANLEDRDQVLAAFLEESEEEELSVEGGKNEVPVALDDKATYYAAAFKRIGQGFTASAERIKLQDLTDEQAKHAKGISMPGALLVPLVGTGNEKELYERAEQLALGAFRRPEKIEAAEVTLIGPWPIQCDGLVSSVSISLAEGSSSYRTTVSIGSTGAAPAGNVTRVRVQSGLDGLRRQGLL